MVQFLACLHGKQETLSSNVSPGDKLSLGIIIPSDIFFLLIFNAYNMNQCSNDILVIFYFLLFLDIILIFIKQENKTENKFQQSSNNKILAL